MKALIFSRKIAISLFLNILILYSYSQNCESSFRLNGGRTRYQVNPPNGSLTYGDFIDPVNGFTWEAWVNLQSYQTQSGIGTILTAGDAASYEDHFICINGNGIPRFTLRPLNNAGSSEITCLGSSSIPLNVWTHIAAVCDGAGIINSSIRLYVNGILIDTRQIPNNFTRLNRLNIPFTIGDFSDNSGFSANCFVDEVRIWRGSRTANQILQSMNGCMQLPQANLLAFFRANEGSGNTANSAVNSLTARSINGGWNTQVPNASCAPTLAIQTSSDSTCSSEQTPVTLTASLAQNAQGASFLWSNGAST